MSIVLITGIQASGKSTVAQALAETFPRSVHVRGDTFRRFVVSGRSEMGAPSPSEEAVAQLRLRYELAAATADTYAEAGFTVVVQDIVLGEGLRHFVGRIRSRPISVVVLTPSPAAVRRRDAERQASRGKVAYVEGGVSVDDLDRVLREETPRLGHWLDTSELSVEETVADIRAHLYTDARVARDRAPAGDQGAEWSPGDNGVPHGRGS